jgi:DNA-binding beta-propeller fold protein YncE
MGVYTYDDKGEFTFVRAADAGLGLCWIATNTSGDRVYTSNTLADTISVMDTSDPLKPVKMQEFALAGPPAGPAQLTLDSRGEYLFVVTQKSLDIMPPEANALHALKLASDGTIAAQTDRLIIPVAPSVPQGVIAR